MGRYLEEEGGSAKGVVSGAVDVGAANFPVLSHDSEIVRR